MLTTPEGQIAAEHIVIATSFWSRELTEQLGLNLPLYALEHHEVVTGAVPELEELNFEVPTVRDPYATIEHAPGGKRLSMRRL